MLGFFLHIHKNVILMQTVWKLIFGLVRRNGMVREWKGGWGMGDGMIGGFWD